MPWQIVLGLSVMLGGCTKELPPPAMRAPSAVLVDPATVELAAGASVQLRAQVNDARSQPIGGAVIRFRSDKPQIVQATPQGLLNSPGPSGDALVSVSSGVRTARVSVHVRPGAAASLALVRGPVAQALVGSSLGDIQVRVHDAFDNPVPDAALAWQLGPESGSLESSDTKAGADGVGAARWLAGERAGEQTLTVRCGALPSLVVRVQVTAGPAAAVVIKTEPALNAKASVTQGARLKIWTVVDDQYGNPVGKATVKLRSEGRCRLETAAKSTNDIGTSEPVDWSPDAAGNCVVIARIEDPPLDARLPLTIIRDRKPSRR